MKWFIALVTAICGKVFAGFLQMRLSAELPDADEFIKQWKDQDSDDPRAGFGPPTVGVL